MVIKVLKYNKWQMETTAECLNNHPERPSRGTRRLRTMPTAKPEKALERRDKGCWRSAGREWSTLPTLCDMSTMGENSEANTSSDEWFL